MSECVVVKFSSISAASMQDNVQQTSDMDTNNLKGTNFGVYNFLCLFLSIVTYTLDVAFNCWLAYVYYTLGFGVYFALTVTFIVFPALITTAFSMRWYINDGDEPDMPKPPLWKWGIRVIILLLQIAPLLRYCDTLAYGLRSRAAANVGDISRQIRLHRKMLDEDSDASLLRLFHCFLHAAPQAILQLTFLISSANIRNLTTTQIIQSWAVIFCIISVAWSLTSYHRSVRYARDDKENLSWQGAVMQFCWNLMSTVARVLALSLLAAVFPVWMGTVCFVHWLVMSAWLALGNHSTAVCATRCEEILFSFVLGIAYIVAYVAPRDGPTRYSYLAYYLVFFLENTGALVVWCVSSNSSQNRILYYGAVLCQVSSFLLAIIFMLVYYRYYHPSGTSAVLRKSITITDMEMTKPGNSKNRAQTL